MARLTGPIRAAVIVLVAALTAAVLPATAAHAEGPGSVTFTVTADGAPAVRSVFLSGTAFRFGQTDASGSLSFADLPLGGYQFSIGGTATHQPYTAPFTLTEEEPSAEFNVELLPWPTGDGAISGTVVDSATGEPIPDIEVASWRVDEQGPQQSTTSGPDGAFAFAGLVAGRYVVHVDVIPGYFSASAEVDVVDGEPAIVELALVAADAQISGRVVDPSGQGVGGVNVGATSGIGSASAQTDSDGYYTVSGAGAGTWTLYVYATDEWEMSTVTVEVAAGSTATAPDHVLVPRTTGTVSGLVRSADGIPESEIGGFFDVCVTALTPDGQPVPGASMVTGGDSFYFFWLQPGDYTVYFEDCDEDRVPRYQPVYLGGSPTLEGARIVTVETLGAVWLDETILSPEVAEPEPGHDPAPVGRKALSKSLEDLIGAPATVARGDLVEIAVGEQYAGEWVSVWLHSGPTALGGWHRVAADGTIEVTIPEDAAVGHRHLVVQDADDTVIGWTKVRVRR